MGLKD